jgi:hypothetical protein
MSTMIRFQFDLQKAIQAMAFVIQRVGRVEKVKLTKLLYIADKQHFLQHGYPITGDRQCAMQWGPLPSECLHALNGEFWPKLEEPFQFLHVNDNWVTVRKEPGTDRLNAAELQTLDDVVRNHGAKACWTLVGETHRYPEYKEAYIEGTSNPIPYELILKHSGRQDLYRHDRPVISPATIPHMISPFAAPETDL